MHLTIEPEFKISPEGARNLARGKERSPEFGLPRYPRPEWGAGNGVNIFPAPHSGRTSKNNCISGLRFLPRATYLYPLGVFIKLTLFLAEMSNPKTPQSGRNVGRNY